MVVVVIVVVIVRSLTGTVGPHSTSGLTVVAATAPASARFYQVVAHEELQLGGERSVVLAEVAERSPEAGFVGHDVILSRVIVGRVTARPLPRCPRATVPAWATRSGLSACSTRTAARSRSASCSA